MENTGPRKDVHFLPAFRTISSSISRIDGSFREITKTEGFPVCCLNHIFSPNWHERDSPLSTYGSVHLVGGRVPGIALWKN